jgi:hypothetical protein
MEKAAQEWCLEWKCHVREGKVENNWPTFVSELRRRFTDENEANIAYRELESLTYQKDIHTFLIRWDALCFRAGVSGVSYRKMLFTAIGPILRERMERYDRANNDKDFRAHVLNAGRNLEDWARERRREDRPRPARDAPRPTPTPRPMAIPQRSQTMAFRPRTVEPRGANPKPNPPRVERRFATVDEAIKGVPEGVVEARLKQGKCLRCGWTEHVATYCLCPLDSRMPAREGRVAGLKRGMEEGYDDEGEYEVEEIERQKRSRFEVAALDAQEMPLFGGYESEDNYSD